MRDSRDLHLGNLFLNAAGLPCLLDWQLVQRGMWYVDVGYHIASTLTVEDRRASEHELLRHYLRCRPSTALNRRRGMRPGAQ